MITVKDASPATVVRLRDEERLLRGTAVAGVVLTWSGYAVGALIQLLADAPPPPTGVALATVAALSCFGPGCWALLRIRYVLARRQLRADLGRAG